VTLIGGDWECYAGEFHGCPCAPSRKRNAQDVSPRYNRL
jgi:hypothetical protein